MTGIATIAFKDIPPYILAAGNTARPHGINVRGLKRRQFSPETIEALRRAYKILYRSNKRLQEAIRSLEGDASGIAEVHHLLSFIKASKRGIIR